MNFEAKVHVTANHEQYVQEVAKSVIAYWDELDQGGLPHALAQEIVAEYARQIHSATILVPRPVAITKGDLDGQADS
ncbi:MAG: hypothetical protein M3O41_14335 [Pseudomonadota bacterium]|nr:hypothetical protein [Pseudomonadota bacterium]